MSAWKPMTVCSDVLTIPVGGTALASRDSRSTRLIIQRVYVSTTHVFWSTEYSRFDSYIPSS